MNAYPVIARPTPGKQRPYSAKHLIPLVASSQDDWFATSPVPVVKPPFQQENEEELHTSFDQALNERLGSITWRLAQSSGPLLDTPQVQPVVLPAQQASTTGEVALHSTVLQLQPITSRLSASATTLRYTFISVCLAIIFLLLGFDFMGLLILHMR